MVYKNKYKILNERLYIPQGTTCIPDGEFKGLYNIETAYIPNSVIYIGEQAFSCCFGLKRVVFEGGSQCRFIFDRAFELCKDLSEINLPDTVEAIGEECFLLNNGIINLSLPKSLKEIREGAFKLSNIQTLKFNGYRVVHLNDKSFSLMEKLNTVYIQNKKYSVVSGLETISIVPLSKKNIKDIIITSGCEVGFLLGGEKKHYFICSTVDGTIKTMNRTLRDAFQELEDKRNLNVAQKAIDEEWDINTKIDYKQYTAMSKNCWIYTLEFMQNSGIPKDAKVPIIDVIKMTKGERNYDVFLDFVRKYVKGGEAF